MKRRGFLFIVAFLLLVSSLSVSAQVCPANETFEGCGGTPTACSDHSIATCESFDGCVVANGRPGSTSTTPWTDNLAVMSTWTGWDTEGDGIFYETNDPSHCINDANDDCVGVDDDSQGAKFLRVSSSIDLSDCLADSAELHVAKIVEEGNLERSGAILGGDDCVHVDFSDDNGASYTVTTALFCGDRSSTTGVSRYIPNSFLVPNFKFRLEKEGFSANPVFGDEERAWLDGFRITCLTEVPASSSCSGTPAACSTYDNDVAACDNHGCSPICEGPDLGFCGDGIVQQPNTNGFNESCDNGASNGVACNPAYASTCFYCSNSCTVLSNEGGFCGDNITEANFEQCDDGNLDITDQCDTANSCIFTFCGDLTVQQPNGIGQNESCDDGNLVNNDGCSNSCELPFCGDGMLNNDEVCDDGNLVNNDGCSDTCELELDFGDATAPYPTLLANDGARHVISSLFMGVSVDLEADGQLSGPANGDDADGNDDENGVFPADPFFILGTTKNITVQAIDAGYFNAWFDFTNDGDWDDAGEHPIDDVLLSPGSTVVQIPVPLGGTPTAQLIARFRLSGQQNLNYTGLAPDGEVEDHQYILALPEPGCGNGFIDDGEQCDDHNLINGDGCSDTCELECEQDDDNDRVCDDVDRCLDTPQFLPVDQDGCSQEQFCATQAQCGPRCDTANWLGNDYLYQNEIQIYPHQDCQTVIGHQNGIPIPMCVPVLQCLA